MSNNRRNHAYSNQGDFDASWIPVFIMLFVFWPVGLYMLYKKIKGSASPEQKRRKTISWTSAGLCALGALILMSSDGNIGMFTLLGGGALFYYTRKMKSDERLFNKYANVIGSRTVVPISAIAASMPVSYEQATQDLQKMIDQGYFGQYAYLDMNLGNFVSDSRTSQTFVDQLRQKFEAQRAQYHGKQGATVVPTVVAQQAKPEPKPEPVVDARSQIEREFQEKLDAIRKVNAMIKDEDISAKVHRIEQVTGNIFEVVKEKPERRSEIHTFMNYYLPTTLKLLNSYSVLERQNVLGENIVSTKANIEKMVDQLVFAFEQQLDEMFESEARDISSDITVLERMMARDGLVESPYTLPKMPQQKKTASPFATSSDFGTGQAVQQQQEKKEN